MPSIRSLTKSAAHGLKVAGTAVVDADLTKPVKVVADVAGGVKDKAVETKENIHKSRVIHKANKSKALVLANLVKMAQERQNEQAS